MSGADLSRLDLRYINFKLANLAGCNLAEANLAFSCLERADLSDCILDVSKLDLTHDVHCYITKEARETPLGTHSCAVEI